MNKGITAIYCRIAQPSAPGDAAAALQRESLLCYAGRHGYENIKCYEDTGFGGLAFTGRTAFQKLLEDIADGRIKRVIAKDISRISRNTAEAVRWVSSLRAEGMDFIFTSHPELPIGIFQILYGTGKEAGNEQLYFKSRP